MSTILHNYAIDYTYRRAMNRDGRTAMLTTLMQPTTAVWSHESEKQCTVCAYIQCINYTDALVLIKFGC